MENLVLKSFNGSAKIFGFKIFHKEGVRRFMAVIRSD